MKDNNNNANNINVIPNLFRNLKKTKILKQVQDDVTGSLALGGTLVEPTNKVELSETACRMAEWVGRVGNPLQYDVTTCAPLVGEPKSLISKGGENVLDYNQEPSSGFVSDKNRLDCFAFARNDEIVEFEDNKILNPSWIIGGSAGSTQPSPGRASLLPKSAVQDDNIGRHPEGDSPKDLQTLGSRFFAHASRGCKAEPYPFNARVAQNAKDKNVKTLVPQCPSIPSLTNLFPYFPISFSLNKKLRRFRIKSGMTFIKQSAFTLAETLITLGIIGIVAAMTIPALLTKLSNDRDSAILKEDYSILQQMMKSANEEGAMANIQNYNDIDEMTNWFKTYFLPFIKTTNVCYDKWGCWSKDVKESNGRTFTTSTACGYRSISFVLNNGSYICMDDFSDSRFGVVPNVMTIGLMVDVNGDKKPNTIGKDIFTLVFKDEQLFPGGYDMTKEEIENSCSSKCDLGRLRCGSFCMVKAKNQGFKLPVMSDK